MLIVETGDGVAGSDTYASLAHAGAYNAARVPNREVWLRHDVVELEAALIDARRALDAMFGWRGRRKFTGQALPLPRDYAYDDDGNLISSENMLAAAADAQSQLAYRILEERDAQATSGLGSSIYSSERIGDWAASYRERKVREWPEIAQMLVGLVATGATGSGYGQVRRERWS